MKSRHLAILVMTAAVLAVLAYVTSRRDGVPTTGTRLSGEPVLPALQDADRLNSIRRIVLSSADSTVTVARTGEEWTAPDKYDYPADFSAVSAFVNSLADLKIGQVMPDDPRQLKELGILPSDKPAPDDDHRPVTVTLMDASSNTVASLIVGRERMRTAPDSPYSQGMGGYPDGRYVAAGGAAYLVSESFSRMPENATEWLDRKISDLAPSDITEIVVSDSEDNIATIERSGDNNALQVPDLAEKEEMDSAKTTAIAGVLQYLRFKDVADPMLDPGAAGLDKPLTYSASTKTGKVYILTVGGSPKDTTDRYATIRCELAPVPETEATADTDRTNETEDTKTDKQKEREKLETEVRDFNFKHGKWIYVIDSYAIDKITAKRADLVKPKEEKKD